MNRFHCFYTFRIGAECCDRASELKLTQRQLFANRSVENLKDSSSQEKLLTFKADRKYLIEKSFRALQREALHLDPHSPLHVTSEFTFFSACILTTGPQPEKTKNRFKKHHAEKRNMKTVKVCPVFATKK